MDHFKAVSASNYQKVSNKGIALSACLCGGGNNNSWVREQEVPGNSTQHLYISLRLLMKE